MSKYDAGNASGNEYALWRHTKQPACFHGDGSSYDRAAGNSNMEIGKWYHVMCVIDGKLLIAYVNGVRHGSDPILPGTVDKSASPLLINAGAVNAGGAPIYPNTGLSDDVRVYNRALSASEVKQLYLMGR
jgi:hypothetical protein